MVVHETYRDASGYVFPADIRIESDRSGGRKAVHADTGAPIEIGAIEKMSKSKKNVVDPDDIIASYGADTARWFMLSDSPPERDVIWTEEGVQGASRFVQRVWRMVGEVAELPPGEAGSGEAAMALRKAAHKALAALEGDLERLAFNRCVAHLYTLANQVGRALEQQAKAAEPGLAAALHEATGILVQGLAPMMPHLGEECWAALGRQGWSPKPPGPRPIPPWSGMTRSSCPCRSTARSARNSRWRATRGMLWLRPWFVNSIP